MARSITPTAFPALCTILLLMGNPGVKAQERYVLSGRVTDQSTGKSLPLANIYLPALNQGTSSDPEGNFLLHLTRGTHQVLVSSLGFTTDTLQITLPPSRFIEILLSPSRISIGEATVTGSVGQIRSLRQKTGLIQLTPEKMRKIPALMSESDPLAALKSIPGIRSSSEVSGYLHVRGGSADQNLFILDDAVLFNPLHLFGLFSVVNPSVLQSVSVYKSAIPARYGGRLSSVVDFQTRPGNSRRLSGEIRTGILASQVLLEGPLIKNKLSLLVSARRTHLDLLARPFINRSSSFSGSGYFFYDVNTVAHYRINDRNSLKFSFYRGNDDFLLNDREFRISEKLQWGNLTSSLRWESVLAPGLRSQVALAATDYDFGMNFSQNIYSGDITTRIREYRFLGGVIWQARPGITLRMGGEYNFNSLTPNQMVAETDSRIIRVSEPLPLRSSEQALYIESDLSPSDRLDIQAGIRVMRFTHLGPFLRYLTGPEGQVYDSTYYTTNQPVVTYLRVEPRLSMMYRIHEKFALKTSLTHQYQPLHMVPYSLISLPADLWVTSTSEIPPQEGTTLTLGGFAEWADGGIEVSAEGYYRSLKNQTELATGLYLFDFLRNNYDRQFALGKGSVYGIELMIRKTTGKNQGWIGYTWSKALREFESINNGEPFYSRHDRRHEINLVWQRSLSERLDLSVQFVFASGQPATVPRSLYFLGGYVMSAYTDKDSFRLPPYHRLDIGISRPSKNVKKGNSTWTFSVYNLYNRLNPFLLYYETSWDTETQIFEARGRQISLLPVVPSIGWTYRF